MAFLTEPLGRLDALILGEYPDVAVPGRSVPAGTFRRATYRGDPADLGWVGTGWHRCFARRVLSSGDNGADPPNVRAGAQRRRVLVEVSLGYEISPDATTSRTTVCATVDEATALGHSDHELLAQALRWPGFWPGTAPSIVRLEPAGDVTTSVVIPRRRIVVAAQWSITLAYAPGTVWP